MCEQAWHGSGDIDHHQEALCFWVNHFHALRFIFSFIGQAIRLDLLIPDIPCPVTLFIMTPGRVQEWQDEDQGKKMESHVQKEVGALNLIIKQKMHSLYQRSEPSRKVQSFEEFLDLFQCSCQAENLSPLKM